MIIYQVDPKHIDVIWSYVNFFLSKVLERGLGEVQLEDVKNWIKNKRQQLWLFLDEKESRIVGACTTEIIIYPNKRHLRIQLVGAEDNKLNMWMEEWTPVAKEFCKQNKLSRIEVIAQRDGWIRLLKDKGYNKYYTVLVKEMKDD